LVGDVQFQILHTRSTGVETEKRQNRFTDLNNEPGNCQISQCGSNDVATFKLGDERHLAAFRFAMADRVDLSRQVDIIVPRKFAWNTQ